MNGLPTCQYEAEGPGWLGEGYQGNSWQTRPSPAGQSWTCCQFEWTRLITALPQSSEFIPGIARWDLSYQHHLYVKLGDILFILKFLLYWFPFNESIYQGFGGNLCITVLCSNSSCEEVILSALSKTRSSCNYCRSAVIIWILRSDLFWNPNVVQPHFMLMFYSFLYIPNN